MKSNLVVVFGGVSCEHDISIITALQAIKSLNKERYEVIPVYITKQNKWLSGDALLDIDYYKNKTVKTKSKVFEVAILPSSNLLYKKTKTGYKKYKDIQVAILSLHGQNGEDGAIPALFELAGIPHTACDLFTSSLCCDKVNFKYFITGLGVPTARFVTINQTEYENDSEGVIDNIINTLGLPVIAKPSKLGSSIGINVCHNKKELKEAIHLALSLGNQLLIEEFLTDIKEVNCALLGSGKDVLVSELEEPIKSSQILSFENKYISDKSSGDMANLTRKMPAEISQDVYDEVVRISKLLFDKLNFKGVVRIDYIIKDDMVYVNEVNTIPGSFANYLFKPKKITFEKLLDKLVYYALNDEVLKQQKIKTFDSDVLNNVSLDGGSKNKYKY